MALCAQTLCRVPGEVAVLGLFRMCRIQYEGLRAMVQERLLEVEDQVLCAVVRHWSEISEAQWRINGLGEVAQKLGYQGALWPRVTFSSEDSVQ